MWLSLGAKQGDTIARIMMHGLADLMTPDQLAEAQRLAREWKPTQREITLEEKITLKETRALAEQGIPWAQFNLGVTYFKGEGVPQDFTEAARWYRLAAEQGNAQAQFVMGQMYWKGVGVPKDDAEAVRWYQLAAEQGEESAQLNLGGMYQWGMGVPQDYVLAYMWHSLAERLIDVQQGSVLDYLEKKMTPAQLAEAQRLAREWKPKGMQ